MRENKKTQWVRPAFIAVAALVLVAGAAAADVVSYVDASMARIDVLREAGDGHLRVSGPNGVVTIPVVAGDVPGFSAFDAEGNLLPDGSYTWELRLAPVLDEAERAELERLRGIGASTSIRGISASGHWRLAGGSFVGEEIEQTETRSAGGPASRPGGQTRDQVILDDLIVDGSACIGFDCVNGESFGFDTIRLKENNLRIKFQDTSVGSFPSADWQLTANESTNGGLSKFSIDDISGGRTPFTIEANAPSHALYVDDGGRLGLTTATPVVELHIVDGDTPTLRLEQDGSSGFQPQIWDVAGNETSFFIRDASNGSTLPFRIQPGAPSQSIWIANDGDIGMGTLSPDAVLDLERTSASDKDVLRISNNGRGNFLFRNTASTGANDTWTVSHANNGVFAFDAGGGNTEMRLQQSGNLLIEGSLTANASTTGDMFPDYVFEPDYELMPLAEVQAFIDREKHLPGVMSAADVDQGRSVNMTKLQLQLLRKVEELTLYTLSQQRLIDELRTRLDESQESDESTVQ